MSSNAIVVLIDYPLYSLYYRFSACVLLDYPPSPLTSERDRTDLRSISTECTDGATSEDIRVITDLKNHVKGSSVGEVWVWQCREHKGHRDEVKNLLNLDG